MPKTIGNINGKEVIRKIVYGPIEENGKNGFGIKYYIDSQCINGPKTITKPSEEMKLWWTAKDFDGRMELAAIRQMEVSLTKIKV